MAWSLDMSRHRSSRGGRSSTSALEAATEAALNPSGSGTSPSSSFGSLPLNQRFVGDPETFAKPGKKGVYYTAADVMGPAGRWSGWGADRRAQLQTALQAAGLIRGDIDHLGVWASESQSAFRRLLEYANQAGVRWQDALGELAQAAQAGGDFDGGVGGGGGAGSLQPPLVVQLPNEEDVRRAVEDAGMALTGTRLPDDLIQSAASSYMDHLRTHQERAYQQEIGLWERGEAGEGGGRAEVMEPQSAEGFIEDQIREKAPGQVMGRGVRDAMESWFEALAGPVP